MSKTYTYREANNLEGSKGGTQWACDMNINGTTKYRLSAMYGKGGRQRIWVRKHGTKELIAKFDEKMGQMSQHKIIEWAWAQVKGIEA